MIEYLNPQYTYQALLIVQALHLLHHRLVKRHISFAEVTSGFVLCIPPIVVGENAAVALSLVHVVLILIQIVGSIWIKRLSPDWSAKG